MPSANQPHEKAAHPGSESDLWPQVNAKMESENQKLMDEPLFLERSKHSKTEKKF